MPKTSGLANFSCVPILQSCTDKSKQDGNTHSLWVSGEVGDLVITNPLKWFLVLPSWSTDSSIRIQEKTLCIAFLDKCATDAHAHVCNCMYMYKVQLQLEYSGISIRAWTQNIRVTWTQTENFVWKATWRWTRTRKLSAILLGLRLGLGRQCPASLVSVFFCFIIFLAIFWFFNP